MKIEGFSPLPMPQATGESPVEEELQGNEVTEESKGRKRGNSEFHAFKDALKKMNKGELSGEEALDLFSDKLQEAAEAVGVNLDTVYNYIASQEEQDVGQLLGIGAGALFFNPNLSRHPKMISLWEKASAWEKENLEEPEAVDEDSQDGEESLLELDEETTLDDSPDGFESEEETEQQLSEEEEVTESFQLFDEPLTIVPEEETESLINSLLPDEESA